jgi:thymidylate synthase
VITGPTFDTFTDAYRAVLAHVRHCPQYTTPTRAKSAIEATNVSFTISNPVARTPYVAARRTNIVFNHAEVLWYLSGRDDAATMVYYAPTLAKLSGDGKTLTGTAYGPRLFAPSTVDGLSQFERVLRLVRDDPDTKRAAMLLMTPDELTDPDNPDVACTLGLQFLLRGGRLNMAAFMRGNDAVIGLLGDTFAFTFIQEFAAHLLGVEIGSYSHHVGSMHINQLDVAKVDQILAEPPSTGFPAEPMPTSTSRADIHAVLAWEERLRHNLGEFTGGEEDLDPYWRRIVALFEVYRQIAHQPDRQVTPEALELLHPGHRWLVEHRWPTRMP